VEFELGSSLIDVGETRPKSIDVTCSGVILTDDILVKLNEI